ncbi:lipocalin family protein [uncultured Alistipes sp.]|uniref:lipocalin family protein n=1 Tax=uncultured Alistipes sp. TaxID=538949 RepID=UPI0026386DC9|nr:lipocalin family protein [uncultured Alistipes sp.]
MKSKTIFRGLCALTAAAAFAACGAGTIEGEWVEPVPGMEGQVQGVKLEPGGRASSATLQYEAWERQGDRLILSGRSIGNGQAIAFTDTLTIEKLTGTELILSKEGRTVNYRKR